MRITSWSNPDRDLDPRWVFLVLVLFFRSLYTLTTVQNPWEEVEKYHTNNRAYTNEVMVSQKRCDGWKDGLTQRRNRPPGWTNTENKLFLLSGFDAYSFRGFLPHSLSFLSLLPSFPSFFLPSFLSLLPSFLLLFSFPSLPCIRWVSFGPETAPSLLSKHSHFECLFWNEERALVRYNLFPSERVVENGLLRTSCWERVVNGPRFQLFMHSEFWLDDRWRQGRQKENSCQ